MTGIRSFVAVDLPGSVRDEIGRIEEDMRTPGLRLVRPDLCHVTLKFLGDVPENRIPRVCESLRGIRGRPFEARVKGAGAFGGRSIRVVWLGLQGDFAGLQKEVEEALRPLGFEPDERGFSPHVTIGRVGHPSRELSEEIRGKIARHVDADLGSFTVDHFVLKKSTLTREGPIYADIEEFPLGD